MLPVRLWIVAATWEAEFRVLQKPMNQTRPALILSSVGREYKIGNSTRRRPAQAPAVTSITDKPVRRQFHIENSSNDESERWTGQ
jgi:hypothetical protein